MEGQNGNISLYKTKENGVKGKPPYSVETPYGFQLDLDFLKYVDDIEKGNTIKRVPIHRRSKGPRASTLPRHLNPSGNGYHPTLWGSTGALGPRSRLSGAHHHSHTSSACDHRSSLSPTGLKSLTEMEARIKEFDEQPLGEHIRPHLLRASSLPLTVLLRQSSESTDDPVSLRSSRDQLGGRNTSCEDIFYSPENPPPQDCSGLLRRLTEALERVRELEMDVRVIPELRAQISVLQEERERLRMGLNPHMHFTSMNGTTDPHTLSCYGTMDVKRPRHECHVIVPKNHTVSQDNSSPTHEWRTSTDLDELLTVTSLQAKVAVLEQKLHETGQELQRTLGLLKEQQEESRRKDDKIEHLTRNPGVWVRAERVVVDQDGDETPRLPDTFGSATVVPTNGQRIQVQDSVVDSTWTEMSPLVSAEPGDTAGIVHHIEKIKKLLDQQCLCTDSETREEGKPLNHQDAKVMSLQQEMAGLVDILTSYYTQHDQTDGDKIPPRASKSIVQTDECFQTSNNQDSEGVNDGHETTASGDGKEGVHDSSVGCWESSSRPREMAEVQVDAYTEKTRMKGERLMTSEAQMISGGTGSGQTDGGTESMEADATQKMAKTRTKPPGEQMERCTSSETSPGGRETVSADFMTACHFLNDHMEKMDNPNDDMRMALVVLFQHWFSAAAEEASVVSRVAVYLREVKKATPSLLAFLVNLADDNGNTVLHYSVSHCNYSIVGLLLDTGVSDVNLQNNAGYTAAMLASLTAPDGPGGMEVVRKIMELGTINIRSNQTGQTALHLAVRHGRVVMVRLLLSCGADTNIQDNQGTTALMFASERGHTHIVRLLLERSQCDLTLTNKRGQTAISIAMQGSHTDTAALLQAHAKARVL